MSLIGILAVLTTVTLWGVNFTFIKMAINEVPALAITAIRFAVLVVLLFPFLRVARRLLPRIVEYSVIMGVGHFTMLFVAMQYLDVTTTGIVLQLGTPFVVLLAWLMLGETFGVWRAAGMGVAFGGIVVLIGVPTAGVDPVWLLTLTASAFMWAFASIRAKQIKGVSPFSLIAWTSLTVAPIAAVLSWMFENGQITAIENASSMFWFSMAYVIIGSSVIGYGLWYWALGRFDVIALAPYNLLTPLVAATGGVAFLGDQLTTTKLIGGGMILGGVTLITLRQVVVARRAKLAPPVPGVPS